MGGEGPADSKGPFQPGLGATAHSDAPRKELVHSGVVLMQCTTPPFFLLFSCMCLCVGLRTGVALCAVCHVCLDPGSRGGTSPPHRGGEAPPPPAPGPGACGRSAKAVFGAKPSSRPLGAPLSAAPAAPSDTPPPPPLWLQPREPEDGSEAAEVRDEVEVGAGAAPRDWDWGPGGGVPAALTLDYPGRGPRTCCRVHGWLRVHRRLRNHG